MRFWKCLTLMILLLCSGCAGIDYYPEMDLDIDVSDVPPPLVEKALTMQQENQPNVLSALVVLAQAGFFWQYGWTAPTTGTAVAKYEVYTRYDVTDNTAWVLNVDKYNLVMEVAGIDSVGRMGPVSAPSDSNNVRVFQ